MRHDIIQRDGDEGALANTDVFTVPPDHFFMMGDNRDNSSDSRVVGGVVGYVPLENLIGRAGDHLLLDRGRRVGLADLALAEDVRWSRLFQRVR